MIDALRNEKPITIKVRLYAVRLIDLNAYLDSFQGEILYDKFYLTELNDIILNIMSNIWYKQAYVQGFDYESILFKKDVNMFERMEVVESIYEGVVEPSYKKPTLVDANRFGHSSYIRGEAALSKTRPATGESADKRRKRYEDFPKIE